MGTRPRGISRYQRIIEHIFLARYEPGDRSVEFLREDIIQAAETLGIRVPKNVGDVVYKFPLSSHVA